MIKFIFLATTGMLMLGTGAAFLNIIMPLYVNTIGGNGLVLLAVGFIAQGIFLIVLGHLSIKE